jgi:hypothetical protein
MDYTRRAILAVIGAGVLAGCSSSGTGGGGDDSGALGGGSGDGSAGTSLEGSCASLFGDTLQPYDSSNRDMISTFSYPMGGEINFEQSDGDRLTSIAYGRGEISPLHGLLVGESGPLGGPDTATEAYDFEEGADSAMVTTFGGETVPAHIRRSEDSVTYLVRVEGPDGTYELFASVGAGEADPCPEVYESVALRVIESFEPVA